MFNWLLMVLWDCSLPELKRSLTGIFEVFSFILLWLRKCTKNFSVKGCQINTFCIRLVIFLHKQKFTMLHLCLNYRHMYIFYRE
jgi:hypothetical protein